MGVAADTASTLKRGSQSMGWDHWVISMGKVASSIRPPRAGFIKFLPRPP